MRYSNPFAGLALAELLDSLLPDFVVATAFFTALIYATLSSRFERQRAAAIAALSAGLALAAGLVWWESEVGLSVRDLGPFAAGFAVLLLGAVMYQAVRQVGGSWAGVGIALGASLLVSKLLAVQWPLDPQVIETLTVVALTVGAMAWLLRRHGHHAYLSPRTVATPIGHSGFRDLQESHVVSDLVDRKLRQLRKKADSLHEQPDLAADIVAQIKRMLPAEGWLTQRMAQLRAKAHQVRRGHVARLEETKEVFRELPTSAKKRAAGQLAARYRQLVGIDQRLERLDRAVAVNEKNIRELSVAAESYATAYEYRKLTDALKQAEKLQRHNSRLFKIIDRTEKKLTVIAQEVAKQAREVSDA